MSLFSIAWRSIQERGVASLLTSLSMALGVLLVVAVVSIYGVVSESFQSSASLGYNLIVGAKGGKLQLTLNTVFYLSQPVENVPYEYYLEFLPAPRRLQEQADAGGIPLDRAGQFSSLVEFAIPVCLGDCYGRFRVVGTTPDFFDKLVFGPRGDKHFEFERGGRNFRHRDEEHGFFEAVVGSVVAREKRVRVGDVIHSTHGDPDGAGHGQGFTVVGILAPSGTPNDRVVFVNVEGFYLMEKHAKELPDEHAAETADEHAAHQAQSPTRDHAQEEHAHDHAEHAEEHAKSPAQGRAEETHAADHAGHAEEHEHEQGDPRDAKPLPLKQREVTAILVRTVNPLVTQSVVKKINKGRDGQAVLPVLEIVTLFETFVAPLKTILLVLTAMICVVSGVGILVSIYNSMSDRRREIAVMRALGAGRGTVMTVVLLESIFLALGGGGAGWLAGHLLNGFVSPFVEAQTGVAISPLNIEWTEALLIPALIVLAIGCGLFPAVSAYRTDVAKSLGA
jgi:putative ABC transport system permease protein